MNNRYKLIKAIKSFCHSPKVVHYELIKKTNKDLYFQLETFCLITRVNFEDILSNYNIIKGIK